jgi:fibro-slime domain-containing protein
MSFALAFGTMKRRFFSGVGCLSLSLGCSASGGAGVPGGIDGGAARGPDNPGTLTGTGGSVTKIDVPDAAPEDCDNVLNVVYRDFKETHPDFEMSFPGDVVRRGLVASELGADSKPVYESPVGCPALSTTPLSCDNWGDTWAQTAMPVLSTRQNFDQWYRDTPDVNIRFEKELVLGDNGAGDYLYSSNAFFPLEPTEGWGITPADHSYLGKNFLFTTEIHLRFSYVAGQKFTFFGDDDLWIFVNRKLALDLGSLHSQASGTIDFDAQAGALGIQPGFAYPMDIFHAERHTDGSNFQIETNIACFTPVQVL